MHAGADEVFGEILSYAGADGRAYHTETGRLPHRYSYGTSSSSRQMLHHPAWAMLTELETVCPIIDAMYNPGGGGGGGGGGGEEDCWAISGAGGDMVHWPTKDLALLGGVAAGGAAALPWPAAALPSCSGTCCRCHCHPLLLNLLLLNGSKPGNPQQQPPNTHCSAVLLRPSRERLSTSPCTATAGHLISGCRSALRASKGALPSHRR